MAQKKYVSLSKLITFLDNLKNIFSPLEHTHVISEVTDFVVDSELSSTSTNPVQNKVIDAEFNAIGDAMGALELAIDSNKIYTQNEEPENAQDGSVWIDLDDNGVGFVKVSDSEINALFTQP